MGKYCRQHIGKTFNDGKLTVVDGGDKEGSVKVKCAVCAEDSELFDNGIFEPQYGNLVSGKLPCGCSKRYIWNLQQYAVKIQRKITDEGLLIEFKGFGISNSRLSCTPVRLFCNTALAEYEVSTISSFFLGAGNYGKSFTAMERLEQYIEGNPRQKVWDTGKKKGTSLLLGFYCGICESNGYESLFTVRSNELFSGQVPCYCSSKWCISGSHVVEVSSNKVQTEGLTNISVIGAYKKGVAWQAVFLCDVHGVYSRSYNDAMARGCHCLKCTPPVTGYNTDKQGYLYLIEIQAQSGTILGYGITNKLNKRLTTHRMNLKSIGATITNIQVFEGSGTAVLAVENAIKALYPTGLIDCEGFRRESISIDMKDKVLEKCSKLKELDNVDKLI